MDSPFLVDFRYDDHKAGIVSRHERSPEAVLKLQWDDRVDIWAAATLANRAVDDRLHIAELVAYSVIYQKNSATRCDWYQCSGIKREAGRGRSQSRIGSLGSLAAGDFVGQDLNGFLQWMRKALQWYPEDGFPGKEERERDGYVLAAADAEMGVGCDDGISVILGSRFYQELSTCIKLYTNPGKVAWYCKLLDGVSGSDDSTKNKM
ncbi:hypothetical protein N7467_012202 [Penicillium canescens]|nr:hypothetical protein N7467_012202 [Penicillium canescens]